VKNKEMSPHTFKCFDCLTFGQNAIEPNASHFLWHTYIFDVV